ncbi:hypothetical protein BZA77DRAFT_304353 [Pyronema omphalodes]|nr:hypothetical protein BZA77DRAFT_304353 [Pyronema omphalodes]
MVTALFALFYLLGLADGVSTDVIQWLPPLRNLTALKEEPAPMWVAQPAYRGTWGILYSCTVTLGLCVYTAIHLNIPAYEDKASKIWLRKIKWMFIALIAPEIVLYTAWSQWYQAREIRDKLNKLVDEHNRKLISGSENTEIARHSTATIGENQTPPKRREERYDLMMGYYIIMGGFVTENPHYIGKIDEETGEMNLSDIGIRVRPQTNRYITLTARDIWRCAEYGTFHRVDRRTIEDKSKADFLAKFLVCSQVIWMVIETSARKLSGYPLTLLEVHVFVHVVCALSMYALWFYKPMDIRSAEVLQDVSRSRGRSRAANIDDITEPGNGWSLLISLILICALYGGIHLSTWHFAFPSDTERLLWKISGIITVSASLLAPGWLWWAKNIFDDGFVTSMQRVLFSWYYLDDAADYFVQISACIVIVTSPVVLATRLFLVVESFISLRSVPAGVYVTVPWAQYIPHL